jgi:methyl-accepting chemotaxis protein
MTGQPVDSRDVALGAVAAGARAGAAAGRVALLPARAALRAPVVGNLMRRAADDLAADGRRLESSARARLKETVEDVIAASDLDVRIAAVLDHELTERTLERVLASPGLERLVVRVLDSRFVDELTERVLQSPEMDRVVEHIASSPQVLDAISAQTMSLTQEMVADVRRATHTADDVAERTVRGWLRRPRPTPS